MLWQYWRMEELLTTYMLQNIAGSLAARLRPPAATASGNRPRSAKKAKTSSQAIFYTLDTQIQLFYTCNTRTRAELQYGKPARAARGGGRVMEVK